MFEFDDAASPETSGEERVPSSSPSCRCYTEAPIQMLVLFHKAMRAELTELRRGVVEVLERSEEDSLIDVAERDFVTSVYKRFEFVEIAYKYHCAAEDEVIFFALDAHVSHVANTYSLEHKSIDGLFKSVSHCLDILMDGGEYFYSPLQELVSCISTLQAAVCKHMMKEEKQVFPLLMKQFSSTEQASLVWRFLCNVPITLLMDLLPWMTSFLPKEEQVDVLRCMREVIPKEKLLQEVVFSWLGKNSCPLVVTSTRTREGAQCFDGLHKSNTFSEEHPVNNFSEIRKITCFLQTNTMLSPIDSVSVWHGAIQKDLKENLEDLYQIRSSKNHTDLASVVVQLKFIADVLTFYSNALDKIVYPVLKEVGNDQLSFSSGRFFNESQIEGLQKSLYYNSTNEMSLCNFVDRLYREVDSFIKLITKQFAFHEREVFPLITKNCDQSTQQQLMYAGLQTMPLGMLKCVTTWFSAHLSERQSMCIIGSLKDGCTTMNKPFASLLLEWIRTGYSGKTSIENFRKDLRSMFETKCFSLLNHIKKDTVSSSVLLNVQRCNGPSHSSVESISSDKVSRIKPESSSSSQISEKRATLYSSGINMQIFFPGTLESVYPATKYHIEETNGETNAHLDPAPIDHILFFHKALKKDLEYLVFGSTQLAENVAFFKDFRQRFHLLKLLYQMHSYGEDEIAFPALKAKANIGENLSNSYTIDHKIEGETFNDISLILDEISDVHGLLSSGSSLYLDKSDHKRLKYLKLCTKLHVACKSMHKIFCDHILHEEIEFWPLFKECLSDQEQEKIIGYMLGRIRAEILEEMIPWLMAYLTPAEQQSLTSLWRKTTRNTMFDEWLREWWVGMKSNYISDTTEKLSTLPSSTIDPLEVISNYLSKECLSEEDEKLFDKGTKYQQKNLVGDDTEQWENHGEQCEKMEEGDEHNHQCLQSSELFSTKMSENVKLPLINLDQGLHVRHQIKHQEQLLSMSQEDLEAIIRRISRDSSLDSQQKSYMIQSLLTRHWTVKPHKGADVVDGDEIVGRSPSYRDSINLSFGCAHYKRNCKLLAACCNQLFACRNCHDEVANHSMDRKATTKMMCMKCLIVQPIGPVCSTMSCNNLSMAKYYCRICKLFDDQRDIYHCPYCNLCRVGKGLGIDYFHCMICNACMGWSLSVHICREKSFEDKCPICHEDIFTSSSPIKALPCGHMMHSSCFQDYTCTHYTCPMCSKSLGDMQVYFRMLDALLAEEKIPDEYTGQTQVVLCNDCEKRGTAPYHWLHHKCSNCGSYNTRLL